MSNDKPTPRTSFLKRLNRALTEVGIEHFDDDKDWDERVKLPAWQLERLRSRYAAKKAAEERQRHRLGASVGQRAADAGPQPVSPASSASVDRRPADAGSQPVTPASSASVRRRAADTESQPASAASSSSEVSGSSEK